MADSANKIEDQIYQFNTDYSLRLKNLNLFSAYTLEESFLDYSGGTNIYRELSEELESQFQRLKSSISTAISINNNRISYPFDFKYFQLSLCHGSIRDRLPAAISGTDGATTRSIWHENSYLFSATFVGGNEKIQFTSYFNVSISFRIPSLYQQVTAWSYPLNTNPGGNLLTEYKSHREWGTSLFNGSTKSKHFPQIQFSWVLFHSLYKNKFRMLHLGGTPLVLFDNYQDAQIFGAESDLSVIFHRICSFNMAFVKYIIPDKAAFPFKPDSKVSCGATFKLRNLDVDVVGYKESSRYGWIVSQISSDREMILQELVWPEYYNMDIHLKQVFNIWRLKWFISASGRNIFNKSQVLEGIAIRDRRFYLTVGLEFK